MIRFVDLRKADIAGGRFAFYDTVTGHFVTLMGSQVWDIWREFEDDFVLDSPKKIRPGGTVLIDAVQQALLDRFRGLCEPWVFGDCEEARRE